MPKWIKKNNIYDLPIRNSLQKTQHTQSEGIENANGNEKKAAVAIHVS